MLLNACTKALRPLQGQVLHALLRRLLSQSIRFLCENFLDAAWYIQTARMSNPVVFFDVKAGPKDLGRIEMTVRACLDGLVHALMSSLTVLSYCWGP